MAGFTEDEIYTLMCDHEERFNTISDALRKRGEVKLADAIDTFGKDCGSVYAAGDWTVPDTHEQISVPLASDYQPVTKERLHRLLRQAYLTDLPETMKTTLEIGTAFGIAPQSTLFSEPGNIHGR